MNKIILLLSLFFTNNCFAEWSYLDMVQSFPSMVSASAPFNDLATSNTEGFSYLDIVNNAPSMLETVVNHF